MINHEFHWAAGTNISIADIALWRFLGWLQSGIIDHIPKEICKPFANLTSIFNEVDCHPKVKEWVLKYFTHSDDREILRGGDYSSNPDDVKSTSFIYEFPNIQHNSIGFRTN